MRKLFIPTLLVILFGCQNLSSDMERKIPFNSDWKFQLGDHPEAVEPGFDDSGWRLLDLPHDWAIEGDFSSEHSSGTGYLPGGVGWYRKVEHLPKSLNNKVVYIQFDGAYQNTELWINGHFIGKRPYGYISFYYDISEYIRPGEMNTFVVRLDHSNTGDSRWYTGNGIYRNVWLIQSNKVHVKPWGTAVSTHDISKEAAQVHVQTELQSALEENTAVTIRNSILNREGESVAESSKEVVISSLGETVVRDQMAILQPDLWSPETPHIYQLKTVLLMNGKVVDEYMTAFGVRSIAFDPDHGFTCNGKSYKLKGVCLHHDFGPLGAARHPRSAHRILKKLKAAGVNAIRTSHNPEDPAFLTMLDTMGFFVQEEAFDEWRYGKKKWLQGRNVGREEGEKGLDVYYGTGGYSDFFAEWAEQDIKDMVKRDRNHPSIIMWSIGNEIDYSNDPYADKSDDFWEPSKPDPAELAVIARQLTAWVKEVDTTRFVTAALANMPIANRVGYPDALDIVGYNYQEKFYGEDHKTYPDRVIYGSENGAILAAWEAVLNNEFISGQFLWTGLDYHGEAGAFPRHSAGAGQLDMCGFEKAIYFQRKSWWTEEPMIKAFARDFESYPPYDAYRVKMHWNFEPGTSLWVGCFTNCEEAEAFLNGRSLGRKNMSRLDMSRNQWEIPYESGELVMVGYRNGEKVSEDVLQTASEFSGLALAAYEDALMSDGQDIVHVKVEGVDVNGILVPAADHQVDFEVSGGAEILGICSSDLRSTESYRGTHRKLYQGRALVVLRSNGKAEPAILTARSGEVTNSLTIPTGR